MAGGRDNTYKDNQERQKIYVSYDYPHSLMMHISKLLKKKQLKGAGHLLDEGFLDLYEEEYPEFSHEIVELEEAVNQRIIQGFMEKKDAPEWDKKVFISVSLAKLVRVVREYEAVELMETLMFLFRWEMKLEIDRRWEAPDNEKAWYHQFRKPGELGYEDFEHKAKEYLEYQQKEREKTEKRRALRNRMRQRGRRQSEAEEFLESNQKEEVPDMPQAWKKTAGNTRTRRDGNGGIYSKAAKNSTPKDRLFFEEMTEEEYKKELSAVQVKHENLMGVSLRKDAKRAKRGEQAAQYHLGEFYGEEGTPHTDYREAVRWYGFSARQGNSRAKLEMGRIFDRGKIEGKETKLQGIRYFSELALENYPTAQYILGMKYYLGDGVEKDISRGVHWLIKAGNQNVVEAQMQLGDIYMLSDLEEAKRWYEKAKALGEPAAEAKLRQL